MAPASKAAHDSHRFMQKFRARSMHKAAQHKQTHAVHSARANGCSGTKAAEWHMARGESGDDERRSRPC